MIMRTAGMAPKASHLINPKFFLRNNTQRFKNTIIWEAYAFFSFDLEMYTYCISPHSPNFSNPHSPDHSKHLA